LITKSTITKPVSIQALTLTKRIALRRGIWYKTLNRIERAVIDLTVRYVDDIKSSKLAKIVTAIIDKLQNTMESATDRLIRTAGLVLTRKISVIAIKLGNKSASEWAEDHAFAQFLLVNSGKFGGA